MIGAPNTRGQKYWVGIVQWAPETSVLEEIEDIFHNYNVDIYIWLNAGYVPFANAYGKHDVVQIIMKWSFPFTLSGACSSEFISLRISKCLWKTQCGSKKSQIKFSINVSYWYWCWIPLLVSIMTYRMIQSSLYIYIYVYLVKCRLCLFLH